MQRKLFIKTKGSNIVGVNCLIPSSGKGSNVPYAKNIPTLMEVKGTARTRVSTLIAINEILAEVDLKGLVKPMEIFIPDYWLEAYSKDWYKLWLISGKSTSGHDIHPEELKGWKEFAKIMAKKGHLITFKSYISANWKGNTPPKFEKDNIMHSQAMYNYCEKKMLEVTPNSFSHEIA